MQPSQAKQLLHEIFTSDELNEQSVEEPLCHENQNDLSAYIWAELDGLEPSTLYPDLQSQIDDCSSCRETYHEVKKLLILEREGAFTEPPISLPGLTAAELAAFQPTSPVVEPEEPTVAKIVKELVVDAVRWRLDGLGQMIVDLSEEFVTALQPTALQPEAQPVYLKSSNQELFDVDSPEVADDLHVNIAAREMRRQPDACSITITVDIPSRGGWPNLGDTEVTLALGNEPAETQYTDAFGKAAFTGIDKKKLPYLSVSIQPTTDH